MFTTNAPSTRLDDIESATKPSVPIPSLVVPVRSPSNLINVPKPTALEPLVVWSNFKATPAVFVFALDSVVVTLPVLLAIKSRVV